MTYNNQRHVSVGFPYKAALLSSLYVVYPDIESVGVLVFAGGRVLTPLSQVWF